MVIAVASGKGGTGKTTVATSLALSVDSKVQFVDCDVEEPNAHIFLKPQIKDKISVTIPVPQIDESKCNYCGRCSEVCAYNAIVVLSNRVLFFPELCHGCGGCSLACPEKAIREIPREIGVIERGSVDSIMFLHGKLNIGEPMATPIIRSLKKSINKDIDTVILDAPPGTSCPVIETVKGVDFCLLVTEPTPFGLNDLRLAVEMIKELKIMCGVIINCAGIGDNEIKRYCNDEDIPILMEIPWERNIATSYSKGEPAIETLPYLRKEFLSLYWMIKEICGRSY